MPRKLLMLPRDPGALAGLAWRSSCWAACTLRPHQIAPPASVAILARMRRTLLSAQPCLPAFSAKQLKRRSLAIFDHLAQCGAFSALRRNANSCAFSLGSTSALVTCSRVELSTAAVADWGATWLKNCFNCSLKRVSTLSGTRADRGNASVVHSNGNSV